MQTACGSRCQSSPANMGGAEAHVHVPPRLLHMPAVLKREIASYLTPKDASRMAKCSKAINHDISISKLSMVAKGATVTGWRYQRFRQLELEDFILEDESGSISVEDEEGIPKHRLRIPFMENRTHSIRVTFRYFGGNDFRFYVVAQKSVQSSFKEGRIVWEYEPNDCTGDSNVLFMPVDGEKYYIYADPGPYNQVCLNQITVHVAVFDDSRCNLTNHFQKMFRRGSIRDHVEGGTCLYVKMLQNVTQPLQQSLLSARRVGAGVDGFALAPQQQQQQQNQQNLANTPPLDPALKAYLRATGISSDASSLVALDEIARFLSLYIGYTEKEYREMLDMRGRKAEWDPVAHHPGVTPGFEDDIDDDISGLHGRAADHGIRRRRRRKALTRIWRSFSSFLESCHGIQVENSSSAAMHRNHLAQPRRRNGQQQ